MTDWVAIATTDVQRLNPWHLVRLQHGVISHAQLLASGFSRSAIRQRVRAGRLHLLLPGVYAVGRPTVSREGRWMAAVLRCGEGAALSHASAAEAWEILPHSEHLTEISVSARRNLREGRLRIHRRSLFPTSEVTRRYAIPTTTPALTLVDLAPRLSAHRLERAIDEAAGQGLITSDTLRARLGALPRLPGIRILRRVLDRGEFALTESELELCFLPLAAAAGLPLPQTQAMVSGHRVDFFWPDLGLVVEADSLRWHRTSAAQARDAARDQDHVRAGLTPLRFTHSQVRFEPERVRSTLADVAGRLRDRARPRERSAGSA